MLVLVYFRSKCLVSSIISSGVARGAGGAWPPGASLGGGAGPACRGEF